MFFSFFIFIFGLAAGSFLNSVIYRLKSGENFLSKRSYCPECKHQLAWFDLVPLLSFIILKGRCRYCHKRISWQYPLVELATGLLFVVVFNYQLPITNYQFFNLGNTLNSLFLLIVSCFLIIIFVYDLKHYIIPDEVIYPAILVSSIWYLVSSNFFGFYTKYEILNSIYAALGASAFFGAIVLVSKGRWMGLGDVKLGFFMGLLLGFPNILVALFLSFLVGGMIGTGLVLLGKKSLKSEIPFGPFLSGATLVAMFFGEELIQWYLNLLV